MSSGGNRMTLSATTFSMMARAGAVSPAAYARQRVSDPPRRACLRPAHPPVGVIDAEHEAFDVVLLRDRDELVHDAADEVLAKGFADLIDAGTGARGAWGGGWNTHGILGLADSLRATICWTASARKI